ncbi:MAG: CTP synthetase [Maritimibacter sp.]
MFLMLALYFVAATAIAGSLIVVALSAGFTTMMPILYASIAGFVIALPATWIVAKKLRE